MPNTSKKIHRAQEHRVQQVVSNADLAVARKIKTLIEHFPAPLFEQVLLEIDLLFPGASFRAFFVGYMLALRERGEQ
jgi:hypothetical protein